MKRAKKLIASGTLFCLLAVSSSSKLQARSIASTTAAAVTMSAADQHAGSSHCSRNNRSGGDHRRRYPKHLQGTLTATPTPTTKGSYKNNFTVIEEKCVFISRGFFRREHQWITSEEKPSRMYRFFPLEL